MPFVIPFSKDTPPRDPFVDLPALARRFEAFSRIAAEEGLSVTPYTDERLPHFDLLAPEQRLAAANLFNAYFDVVSEVKEQEQHVYRNLTTVWRMLSKARLLPSTDLFNFVNEDDVIEIYDLDSRQLFRSFNFFPLCTYSLEELYSRPWYDLYERPVDQSQSKHLALLACILSGEVKHTVEIEIDRHIVRERRQINGTRPIRCTLVQPRYVSPLFDRGGKLGGFIHAFRPVESWDEA